VSTLLRNMQATLDRNCRLLCSGLGGYFGADSVATLLRIRWLLWSGFGGYFAPEYAFSRGKHINEHLWYYLFCLMGRVVIVNLGGRNGSFQLTGRICSAVGMVCFKLFGGEFPEVGRSLFGSEQSSQAYSGIQDRGEVVI